MATSTEVNFSLERSVSLGRTSPGQRLIRLHADLDRVPETGRSGLDAQVRWVVWSCPTSAVHRLAGAVLGFGRQAPAVAAHLQRTFSKTVDGCMTVRVLGDCRTIG